MKRPQNPLVFKSSFLFRTLEYISLSQVTHSKFENRATIRVRIIREIKEYNNILYRNPKLTAGYRETWTSEQLGETEELQGIRNRVKPYGTKTTVFVLSVQVMLLRDSRHVQLLSRVVPEDFYEQLEKASTSTSRLPRWMRVTGIPLRTSLSVLNTTAVITSVSE